MTKSVVESWISEESVIAKEGDKERGIYRQRSNASIIIVLTQEVFLTGSVNTWCSCSPI